MTATDDRMHGVAGLRVGAETLLTTEKDMTKLRRLEFDWPVPLRSLAIKIDFAGQGGKMLMALVNKLFEEEFGSNAQTEIRAD